MRNLLRALGGMAAVASMILGVGPVHAASAAPSASSAMRMDVIASHLNNPRGLALGPQDRLYVGEAGLGAGDDQRGVVEGIGPTSSLTLIRRPSSDYPSQSRLISGLPSVGAVEGGGPPEALGADGVAVASHGDDARVYTIIGAAGIPNTTFGHLLRVSPGGTSPSVADVGTVDLAWTDRHKNDPFAPAGQFPDSNPYGVLVTGQHIYVVDAGSNTLDEVLPGGKVQILAYFPNPSISDAVPTCVTQGPDGALYIGTLALAEFFVHGPGTATVYRVDPTTVDPNDLNSVLSAAKVWATGFSTITGCTFGPTGDFYAVEMFSGFTSPTAPAGDVVRVPFAHPGTGRTYFGVGQLHLPNGVAVGNDGTVYATNYSDSPIAGTGEVVRFRAGDDD
jgi:hypothetical protein